MSFADRIRAWLKGETKRSAPSPSTSAASKATTKELEEFMRSRTGVEGYMEPKTAIYSTTLLLVAADGEYLRRPVRDRHGGAGWPPARGLARPGGPAGVRRLRAGAAMIGSAPDN